MSDNQFGWVEIKDGMVVVHRVTDRGDAEVLDRYENEEIVKADKTVKTIRQKIKELLKFQAGYFFENPKRHCNDEEIDILTKLLGETYTPSTFEEDGQEFVKKVEDMKATKT